MLPSLKMPWEVLQARHALPMLDREPSGQQFQEHPWVLQELRACRATTRQKRMPADWSPGALAFGSQSWAGPGREDRGAPGQDRPCVPASLGGSSLHAWAVQRGRVRCPLVAQLP